MIPCEGCTAPDYPGAIIFYAALGWNAWPILLPLLAAWGGSVLTVRWWARRKIN